MPPTTLGFVLPTFPQHGKGRWTDLAATARAAEEAGATALWACDHLFWFGPTIDCFVALAVAATATSSCALGTGVVQLPLRRTAAVAKTAASLQEISAGRMILGVGVGQHEGEFVAAGVDYHQRGRALDEGIDDLRDYWSRADATYAMLPTPHPVPIWIGGSTAPARRRAARVGDAWMPLFIPPHRLAGEFELLRKETEAAGRDAADVTPAVMVFVSLGEPDRARERGTGWLSSMYRLPADRFSRHIVAAPAEECARVIDEYANAGAEHIAVFVTDDVGVDQFASLAAATARWR